MNDANESESGATLTVELDSRGNPDRGQDPDRPLPGVARKVVEVRSLGQASEACLAWIEDNDLGAGNWTGGTVRDASGALVARVSYNGKVWPERA